MSNNVVSETENKIREYINSIPALEHDISLLFRCAINNFALHKAPFSNGKHVVICDYSEGFNYYKQIVDAINDIIIGSGLSLQEFSKLYSRMHPEQTHGCIPTMRMSAVDEYEYSMQDVYLYLIAISVNIKFYELYEKCQYQKRKEHFFFDATIMDEK